MKRSNLFFSLFVAALVFNTDLSAQRRGGGGNYGGGNRNVRSSANSSVNPKLQSEHQRKPKCQRRKNVNIK